MPEDKMKDKYQEEVLPIKRFYIEAFVVALVLIFGMGIYFLWNIDQGYSNKLSPKQYEQLKPQKDIPKAAGKITEGVDLQKVANASPEIIAKGKELFTTNCASCHGDAGKGDGPGAAALNPKPRNFALNDNWKNGRNLTSMFKTLEEGITGSGMTSYQFLPVADRIMIIHYVRTFAPDFPEINAAEIAQLDAAYSVSKGRKTPNTIPVANAVNKMIDEAKPLAAKIESIEKAFATASAPGAKLFNDYTKNKTRAIASLINNQNWKESKEKFFRIVYNSLPENGFKRCILKLKSEEQNELYNFLKSQI